MIDGTRDDGPDDVNDELVASAVDGDDAALERLLRTVGPALTSRVSIHPRFRRSVSVDDILQVSYLEAFLRISSLRTMTVAGFRAWMGRLVDNNLRDAIRGLERDKRSEAGRRDTVGDRGESARTLLARIASEQATAGALAIRREDLGRLSAAVKQLPPTYRRVVEEVDLAERDVGEVALELGRSRGAVHLLRSRAHQRLAELMEIRVES